MPSNGSRTTRSLAAFLAASWVVLCLPRTASPDGSQEPELARRAALALSVNTPLDFGSLADNDGWLEISAFNGVLGDPYHLQIDATIYSGIIDITGDPDAAVAISISGGSASGLSLSNFHTDLGDPPLAGVTLDGTGTLRLRIGARLTIDSANASPGPDLDVPYTITVTYE